jgi:hypothetical protein
MPRIADSETDPGRAAFPRACRCTDKIGSEICAAILPHHLHEDRRMTLVRCRGNRTSTIVALPFSRPAFLNAIPSCPVTSIAKPGLHSGFSPLEEQAFASQDFVVRACAAACCREKDIKASHSFFTGTSPPFAECADKMGSYQQPFLYDAVGQDARSPTKPFDPKAVTRASYTPKPERPKSDGPLISVNRHPE